ncbi:hypothetical protein JW916_10455 [Candidatus Sumerlaeota bacterium]|nr:hypothetical protein [Candidatus Sumerlaeota bacterium]
MRPNLFSTAIVLFWLCMMCSLVVQRIVPYHRDVKSTLIEPEILALQWTDITEWQLIEKNDQPVGAAFLHIEQDFIPSEEELGTAGYWLYQAMDATLPVFGFSQRIRMYMAVNLTPSFNLDDFAARIEAPPLSFRVEGFVQDKRLCFRLAQRRKDILYRVIPLKSVPNLLAALEPMMARHSDLKRGETYTVDIVDPLGTVGTQRAVVKSTGREEIEVGGRTIPVYRIETTLGEATQTRWVDDRGRTIRSELFGGLVSELSWRGEALRLYPQINPDLQESLRVPTLDREEFLKRASEPSPESVQQSEAMVSLLGQMMRGE